MPPVQPPPSRYKLCPQCQQIYPALAEFCLRDESRLIVESRILDGKYILQSRLGAGLTSEVYAAEQPQLGRMVAIKLLPADPDVLRSFDSGVRVIGSVKHEHVVTIYDSGQAEDGRPYIVTEYLEGEDLAQRLGKSGALSGARAVHLWRQAVTAIAAAHRRSIVHGDIKPRNLFLTQRERDEVKEEILKVIDFRIVKRAPVVADATPRGAELARYAAPEVMQDGDATPRSDVYSLGLVLLEMVWGQLAEKGLPGAEADLDAALLQKLGQSIARPEGTLAKPVSGELMALIATTLRRDPAKRPADATGLLPLIKSLPESAPAAPPPDRLASGENLMDSAENHQNSETPQMGVAVLNELLQKLKERELHNTQEREVTQRRRLTRIAIVTAVAGSLGGLLWLGAHLHDAAPKPDAVAVQHDSGSGDASALAAPLAQPPPADLAVRSVVADLAVTEALMLDLGPPTDAGTDNDLGDPRAIKVRFVYTADDEVTAIDCTPEVQAGQPVTDKHGVGIEALIRPGGSCRASGPNASKTYKYDALVQKHVDAAGVRRVHVRLGDSGGSEVTPPTKHDPAGKPDPLLPRPPKPERENGGS